jgi:hypothetical protein
MPTVSSLLGEASRAACTAGLSVGRCLELADNDSSSLHPLSGTIIPSSSHEPFLSRCIRPAIVLPTIYLRLTDPDDRLVIMDYGGSPATRKPKTSITRPGSSSSYRCVSSPARIAWFLAMARPASCQYLVGFEFGLADFNVHIYS